MTYIHYAFPSIDQLRTVIKHVNDRANFHGVGRPKLTFHGSVKLHGTNASVVVGPEPEVYYAQSRSTVLTLEADNAGFAAFALRPEVKDALTCFAVEARDAYFRDRDYVEPFAATTVVYGEWCGGNIQSGVAINGLPKMFVIFAVKLVNQENDDERSIWLMPWDVEKAFDTVAPDGAVLKSAGSPAAVMAEVPIYCIEKFPTYNITIDFVNPAAAQNKLVELTNAVEAECPVGAAFGKQGVGEGIVWTCVGGDPVQFRLSDLVFKVKGAKHSDTKVKVTAAVDIEKVNSIRALAESVVTDHRLEKAIAYLREQGVAEDDLFSMKQVGAFLKWVGNDVLKEETDTILGNGFEPREVTKAVNELAKAWFITRSNA